MGVKDAVISTYIKRIMIPKIITLDSSGFVYEDFRKIGLDVYLRQFFIPESLLSELEKAFSNNKKLLYSIGKKFGYVYASLSNLPNVNKIPRKKFEEYTAFQIIFTEGTYAQKIRHVLDYENRILKLFIKDFIICRKNGLGYLYSSGGTAGIWAWFIGDKTVEGVKLKCQGRGDQECEVVLGPYKKLIKMGYKPIIYDKLEAFKSDQEYENYNKVFKTRWANKSITNLIDASVVKYSRGQITYNDERFFITEASFMYILEKELKKNKDGLNILWDLSFDFGERMAKKSGKQDPCKFIMDFLPAFGFGDILAITKKGKYEIIANYFPWLEWYKDIDFTMFRGILSGVISGFTGKNIKLKKIDKDISGGYLSLHIIQ